jgi:hypothetical protein
MVRFPAARRGAGGGGDVSGDATFGHDGVPCQAGTSRSR